MKIFLYTGLICLGFLIGLFVGHNQGHSCKVEQTPQTTVEGLDIANLDFYIQSGHISVEVFPDGYTSLLYNGPVMSGRDSTFEISYFTQRERIRDFITIYNER